MGDLRHVEERVIRNDYTFPFSPERYQIQKSPIAPTDAGGVTAGRDRGGALGGPIRGERTLPGASCGAEPDGESQRYAR